MDKSKKMRRSSDPTPCKSAEPELTLEQQERIVSALFKERPRERKMPETPCIQCNSEIDCIDCSDDVFVDDSVLEQVSDDLSLLRSQFSELNYPELSKFVPEPWINREIILERLMEIRKCLNNLCQDTSRHDLLDLALQIDLIDRIEKTIEDGGDKHEND